MRQARRCLALLALVWLASPAAADQAEAPAAEVAAPAVSPELSTPRRAFRAFLDRMSRDDKKSAAELIDLSGLSAEAISAKGPELAYMLYYVLSQIVQVEGEVWPLENDEAYEQVPGANDAPSPWSIAALPRYADPRAEVISLGRDDAGRWRFSRETVRQIESLFDDLEEADPVEAPVTKAIVTQTPSLRLRALFPEPLRKKHFLLPTYQWLCLGLLAVVARLAERLFRFLLTQAADRLLPLFDKDLRETTYPLWKPFGRLLHVALWYSGALLIGLPLDVVGFLLVVLKLVTLFAALRALFAVVDLVAGYARRRSRRHEDRYDDLVIPLASSTAKIVFSLLTVIAGLATFNTELPWTVLGGLGIGGVAVALASQEALSNFFGSLMILADHPFQIGDWVVVEGIEGEVESVGFRTTRIRTGLNSLVALPNNKIASASIDNWGRRKYRRYLTRIGVEYGTAPDRIGAFCEGIRELIRRQPHTRKDFYAAYLNDFGDSALEVLLVVYFEAPDWPTELRERDRLLGDILRLADRLGVAFAFPTQTVHLHQEAPSADPPPMDDATRDGQLAGAEVAGELLNYQDRPGRVKFTGPTPIDPDPKLG